MVLACDLGVLEAVNVGEYFPIVVFFILSAVMSCAVIAIPLFISKSKPDKAKNSAYECGFDPFGDSCGVLDIKFYLVAILFIIFDLEIAFMFPWAVAFREIGELGFYSMMYFLIALTIGFIYEWMSGALEWE